MNKDFNKVLSNHTTKFSWIKPRFLMLFFKDFPTSSLRQVALDNTSGALLQRKKILSNSPKNMVMIVLMFGSILLAMQGLNI